MLIREDQPIQKEEWEIEPPEGSIDYKGLLRKYIHYLNRVTHEIKGCDYDIPAPEGFTDEEWKEVCRLLSASYTRL